MGSNFGLYKKEKEAEHWHPSLLASRLYMQSDQPPHSVVTVLFPPPFQSHHPYTLSQNKPSFLKLLLEAVRLTMLPSQKFMVAITWA